MTLALLLLVLFIIGAAHLAYWAVLLIGSMQILDRIQGRSTPTDASKNSTQPAPGKLEANGHTAQYNRLIARGGKNWGCKMLQILLITFVIVFANRWLDAKFPSAPAKPKPPKPPKPPYKPWQRWWMGFVALSTGPLFSSTRLTTGCTQRFAIWPASTPAVGLPPNRVWASAAAPPVPAASTTLPRTLGLVCTWPIAVPPKP